MTYVDNKTSAVLAVHRVEGGTVSERAVHLEILISFSARPFQLLLRLQSDTSLCRAWRVRGQSS